MTPGAHVVLSLSSFSLCSFGQPCADKYPIRHMTVVRIWYSRIVKSLPGNKGPHNELSFWSTSICCCSNWISCAIILSSTFGFVSAANVHAGQRPPQSLLTKSTYVDFSSSIFRQSPVCASLVMVPHSLREINVVLFKCGVRDFFDGSKAGIHCCLDL